MAPVGGRATPAWAAALLVMAAIVAFATTLPGQFVYDDDEAIVRNPHIRALWPLWAAMAAPPQSAVSGRPLVSLSLALNHAVEGLDPTGYHLWNIAVHAGVALLLFGVLRRTLRAQRLSRTSVTLPMGCRWCVPCSGSCTR